nr:hypothetical protein [uncultured Marvinbryantia sp.]
MKKKPKGTYGYINYEKKKRILLTIVLFAIPILIYVTGYLQTGTRKNLFTFVGIMGCLPASKCAVGMIMICMQKPMKAELYDLFSRHVRDLTAVYETTVSSEKKNYPLPCIVICGQNVVCYSEDAKVDKEYLQQHIKKILQGNGYRSNVKIFTEQKAFLRRVDELYANRDEIEAAATFKPDERYPDATRDELVKSVLLCICL